MPKPKSDIAAAVETVLIVTNFVEWLTLILYFWGVVLPDNFYIYANVFQYAVGAIGFAAIALEYIHRAESHLPHDPQERNQLTPCVFHVLWHVSGHVVAKSTIGYARTGAVMFMIGKAIAAVTINTVFLIVD